MQALASRRRLGTCEKTVFCCERHALCATPVNVLFFSLHYVNLTIPKRRETTFPFPAWDARKYWSKIPFTPLVDTPIQEHWTHFATDPFLEPIAVWNWLNH